MLFVKSVCPVTIILLFAHFNPKVNPNPTLSLKEVFNFLFLALGAIKVRATKA
jgi:anaerobic C4-dicarboxylate transporter